MLACLRSSRVGVITQGYFYAAAAAGFAISIGIALPAAFSGKPSLSMLAFFPVFALMFSAFTIPYTVVLAALPAAGVISLAEWRGIRSPWFYGAMGPFAAAAAVLTVALTILLANGGTATNWSATAVSFASVILLFALPGVVGGLTYWAKAGRDAGCTRAPVNSAAVPG
jgi:hypothetical protein